MKHEKAVRQGYSFFVGCLLLCNYLCLLTTRLETNGILGVSLESLSPLKGFPTATMVPRYASENIGPAQTISCCPQCMQSYEQEVEDMLKEIERADSEVRSEAARPPLPQWLQNSRTNSDVCNVKNQTQVKLSRN